MAGFDLFGLAGGRDPRSTGGVIAVTPDGWLVPLPAGDPAPAGAVVEIGLIDTGLALGPGDALPPWIDPDRVRLGDGDADEIPAGRDGRRPDAAGHGTFMAATILGAAPLAVLHVRGVVDDTTPPEAEDAAVAGAIRSLPDTVKLINLSFSGSEESEPPALLLEALNELPADVVVVAAAGNDSSHRYAFPAAIHPAHALMVSVGAVDESIAVPVPGLATPPIADFSNHWPGISVFASGVGVLGPGRDGGTVARSGTSVATALVSGVIAASAAQTYGGDVRTAAEKLLEPVDGETITVRSINGDWRSRYVPTGAQVRERSW